MRLIFRWLMMSIRLPVAEFLHAEARPRWIAPRRQQCRKAIYAFAAAEAPRRCFMSPPQMIFAGQAEMGRRAPEAAAADRLMISFSRRFSAAAAAMLAVCTLRHCTDTADMFSMRRQHFRQIRPASYHVTSPLLLAEERCCDAARMRLIVPPAMPS